MKKLVYSFLLLLFAALPLTAQISDDGLIAYYSFDGNANDNSGNGLDGTVYGAQLTTDHYGNLNSAYSFDGVDDYIDLGSNSALKPEPPFSFAFWAYHSNTSGIAPFFVTDLHADRYYGASISTNADDLLSIQLGDGNYLGPYARRNEIATTTPQTGTWFHVVGIVDASENMYLYINGVQVTTTSAGYGGSLAYSTSSAVFGAMDTQRNGDPHYLNGKIDEFYFYNRILEEEEIKILAETDLIAYYPMNGDANDYSGNGLDGDVIGAQLTTDRNENLSSAYYFDGVDDYINLGNSSKLKPSPPYSVAFWGYSYNATTSSPFFATDVDETRYYGVAIQLNGDQKIAIQYGNGNGIGPYSRHTEYATNNIPGANTWFHVVGTIDASLNMKLYIDGEQIATSTSGTASTLVYSTNDAALGLFDTNQLADANYLYGKIDDVLFFDRLLSAQEIEDLAGYNFAKTNPGAAES